MESQSLRTVVRRLRQVVAPPAVDGPDAELVRAFTARGDARAFAQIVRRHGPMVLGVCRRVLRDAADADDAFQATFLVLLRKAASLRQPERLGAWLHQVAHRTARKLRAIRLARQARETELSNVWLGEPPADIVWRELRPVFDQELDQLPEKLRLPAVLCFLEGHSKRDAARTLGWPEGTLAGRLQQARERLRIRFAARGLTLSAAALAVALFEGVGSAALPDRLLASTIQLAGTGPGGAIASAGVRVLADGVSQAMVTTKVKAIAATVLIAGMIGTGTGVVLVPGSGPGEIVAADSPKEAVKKAQPGDAKEGRKRIDRAVEVAERDALVAELDALKERAAYEERMVKKGFMTEAQVKKTRAEIARAEAALANWDAPKAPDPRRAAMEEVIRKMEEIVAAKRDGVRKGVIPQSELLEAERAVLEYKVKLLELPDQHPANRPTPSRDPVVVLDELNDLAQRKEEDLNRAEVLFKQNAISLQEIRQRRAAMSQLRAEVAEQSGDYAAALKHREAVVGGWENEAADAKKLYERSAISRAEVRAIEVSLAEAKVEAHRTAVRKHLAEIVSVREQEFKDARTLFDIRAISAEELRKAEQALSHAKLRLAESR
jgi:RNA polymerase sigma factor (sigma-70 family)